MGAAAGLLLILVGVLFFTQTTVGDAVARIQSYSTGKRPAYAGPRGSAYVPQPYKGLRVRVGIRRGDPTVRSIIGSACRKVGGGWTVISWHRPNDSDSCHRFGKGTRKGALDVIPNDGDWDRADALVAELIVTPGVGEVIFRGDADHDPDLGASPPHVHAAVGCG
jgi:hypothetical protein